MPDKSHGTIHKVDAAFVGLISYPQWGLPQQKNEGIVFIWRIKSAIIVVSGPFLQIPGAIDKLLDFQLIDAVLAQMLVNNFFSDQVQTMIYIVAAHGKHLLSEASKNQSRSIADKLPAMLPFGLHTLPCL